MRLTRRILSTLLAPAVVAGLTLAAPAGAAHAAGGTVVMSSVPGVLFEGCEDHPLNYSVTTTSDVDGWSLDLDIQAPDGTLSAVAFKYFTAKEPSSGAMYAGLCSFDDGPGTYTVTGTLTIFATGQTTTPVPAFTFDMRMPHGAVTARASDKTPRIGQKVKVTVTTTDERPSGGFFPTENSSVLLQRKKGDRWVKVRGAKGITGPDGVARVKFRQQWRGKTTFRAFANLGYVGKKASVPFMLRTKR